MLRRLRDYLGRATDYIDLIIDQSPSGKMEIVAGAQEYDVAANWKLMVENSVDDYHLPSTHSTWLNYMANSGVKIERPKEGMVLPTHGLAVDLGNGHFTTDNVNFRGRPVAAWIPIYGEEAKPEMEAIRAELVARLGPERAKRVCDTNRNLVIFPNLVLNDGSSVTVRTFFPDGAGKMHVTAWALGPVEETKRRARAGSMRSSLSTAPAGSPRPMTSKRSNWCSRGSPIGRTTAGPRCRAAWDAKANSSTATSIICASSGASGAR